MNSLPASNSMQVPAVVRGCLEACGRCRQLVVAIADGESADSRKAYAAIGRQLRHCVDHFLSLLCGFDSGAVNYDARDRDERLEQDPGYFLSVMDEIVGRLRELDPACLSERLTLQQEVAPGGECRKVQTNLERELVFLSSHTIHHIAIMSLLAEAQGIEVPQGLGVAFSTASYMQQPSTSGAA